QIQFFLFLRQLQMKPIPSLTYSNQKQETSVFLFLYVPSKPSSTSLFRGLENFHTSQILQEIKTLHFQSFRCG
ncbi:hypothetical protein E2320_004069, partial [Naja naja]